MGRLNFVSIFGVFMLALFILAPRICLADPTPFSQTAPVDTDVKSAVPQQTIIAELKLKAVKQWMLRFVGPNRYGVFDKFITQDIADQYVIKYALGRLANDRNQWELTGKLDNDGLKRWVRLSETKMGQGAMVAPCLIVSNEIETFNPAKNGTGWIEVPLQNVLSRLNTTLTDPMPELGRPIPPRTSEEIETFGERLRSFGLAASVWIHFSKTEVGSGQMEILYFTATPAQLSFTVKHPFPSRPEIMANKKLQAFFEEKMPPLQIAMEELVGGGSLVSKNFRIKIMGVDTFAKFKKLDQAIPMMDPITRVVLKSAEAQTVEYEVGSTLKIEEFYAQLGSYRVGPFFLKPESQDSERIVARLVPNPF